MQLARSRIFADPARLVGDRRMQLDQQALRLRRLAAAACARAGERVAAAAGRLEAGSPLHLLARGWSVTRRPGNAQALRSVAGLAAGDALETIVADGRITSHVERIDHDTIGR